MTQRILVAEPNRDTRSLLRRYLSAQGFEIIQAKEGNAAWKLIRLEEPNLVLMQVALPGMSSREIVRRIRADRRRADMGVFCFGESIVADELVQWFKLGIDNYIDYPLSMQVLVAQIRAHFRRIGA